MQKDKTIEEKSNSEKISICILIVCTVLCIIMGLLIYKTIFNSLTVSGKAANEAFWDSYDDSKEKTYSEYYNYAFNKAEKENQVFNNVSVIIERIREISKLDVYEAYDTEYVINKKDSGNEYESWYEINGVCTYYIDLEKSEFIIDKERKSITVRIPSPEKRYNIEPPKQLMFGDETLEILWLEFNNGSTKEGADISHNTEIHGREMIKNYFMNNDTLEQKSRDAASKILQSLIKKVNNEVDNLKVEVEFLG